FHDRVELLRAHGTVAAVRRLATAYVGASEVQRGTLAAAEPFRPTERLIVADAPSSDATVSVRCKREASPERGAAFLTACASVLPDGAKVRIIPPRKRFQPERRGFSLGAPEQLTERRI